MAIISDYEEDPKPSSSSQPTKTASFSATLDPSNPVGFLEKVFDFLAKESDFLGKGTADKEILELVRASKEKSKRKAEEEAAKAAASKQPKEEKEVKQEVRKEKEVKEEATAVDKKEESGLKG